jgi:predicted phage replisome organizer
MAEAKKFYWLKLNKDFFKRHDIRIIEEMENGKDYILFYLKLLLESVNHEGHLRFSETIPYNEKMLSVITNTNIDIVRSAMKVLLELKMIEVLDDSTIYMAEVLKITGSETAAAERKRRSRQNQKALPSCDIVTKCHTEIEIEKELEKDKDKEIELEIKKDKSDKPTKPPRHKYGRYNNVLLTDEDMEKLQAEYPTDYQERIERLSEYIESKGAKYKNHLATIRAWDRRDKEKNDKPSEQQSNNPFLRALQGGGFDE